MLTMAVRELDGPVAVRYPRGAEGDYHACALTPSVVHTRGNDLTILCYGTMINSVMQAQALLEKQGISCEVIRLTRIDTLDLDTVFASVKKTKRLLAAEETADAGCVGRRVLAACAEQGITLSAARCLNLGRGIVPHGTVEQLRALYALDGNGVAYAALSMLDRL
jgi:1-deoxy-D-xylulose-5-phosphate synthase